MNRFTARTALLALVLWMMAAPVAGAAAQEAVTGQVVYIPAYSHIYSGDKERPFHLAVTLSIRNTSMTEPISVTEVEYFDSEGRFVKRFITSPVEVKPFCSIRYVIEESDKSGGSGAKFVVAWKSKTPVSQPIIEAVMIGTAGQQGISFTSRGQVIGQPN